jgi:hypothetical protein
VITAAIVVALLGIAAPVPSLPKAESKWSCDVNDGAPFGHLGTSGEDILIQFAHQHGLDLRATLKSAYGGDASALARILRLSGAFDQLDVAARVYGNMVYSIFLNLGEARGTSAFIIVLNQQDDAVRQDVRDILWRPLLCVPLDKRSVAEAGARHENPDIWPAGYVFGKGAGIFARAA